MTIDATQPTDSVKQADIPSYIRAIAAALVDSTIEVNAVVLDAVDTDITAGDTAIEIIRLSGNAAARPHTLDSTPSNGQIKVIIALDNNITLIHNTGNLELKGNPAAMDFPMQDGDIVAFIYDSVQASWVEMFRALMP